MHRLPLRAANRLLTALEDLGIAADVHEGYGIALVSVWTDGASFPWWLSELIREALSEIPSRRNANSAP
ncbi:hypothetical protein ABZU75_06180 [Streptosporangium sp. NPDC005286]|uniref:hypothetical protein n=1 Tax=Streptosporangium sp. NPDC005286 TaxID=3154463 RepID=UPI0033B6AF42